MSEKQKEIILPDSIVKAKATDPTELVLFGKPKVGKTTALSLLEDCLIIDLENGSAYIDALKVSVNSLEELRAVCEAIYLREKKYRYIAIDTLTKLEEWCEWEATEDYMKTTIGKKFNRDNNGNILPKKQWESVLTLPQGGGYLYLRNAVKRWIKVFRKLADYRLLICHTRDKSITELGKEVNINAIDLTGKLANIVAADAQGVGYIFPNRSNGDIMITFDTKFVEGGNRSPHLIGQTFPLIEFEGKGADRIVKSNNWNKIYIEQ